MDPAISIRPLVAVAVPGLAALAVLVLRNRETLRDAVSPLAAVILLAIVASIPFGLGWLVLFPVSYLALYASYRDIFIAQSAED